MTRPGARTRVLAWIVLVVASAPSWSVEAQQRPVEPRAPVAYVTVAPGLLGARKFATDAVPGATLEVQDLILGSGKSAPAVTVPGATIVELRSGLAETTIDGHVLLRRPGDYWVVLPGQAYAVRSLEGLVVLRAHVFSRR
jgi:hypothetical protein